jgi:hypothetical protein
VCCNVGSDQQPHDARIAFTDLGDDNPRAAAVAVYDWRRGRVDVIPAAGSYDVTLEHLDWDYRVLAPVLPGGIAVIGDPALYASAGDSRIADVAVDSPGDDVVVTVLGADERVQIVGWSERGISARSWSPAMGAGEVAVAHDATGGRWSVAVDVGPAGWTRLHLRARP